MKPVVKWCGGKRRYTDILSGLLPEKYDRIVEPFCGSAALSFSLEPRRAWINDTCLRLMGFYKTLKKNPELLWRDFQKNLKRLGIGEEAYYQVREKYSWEAWGFLYLNRVGYQGIWRVNQGNQMNVPYGGYSLPSFPSKEDLVAASWVMKHWRLTSVDATSVLAELRTGDVAYVDPPYLGKFDKYTVDGFGLDDHERLEDALMKARTRGAHVILSNSDTPETRALYSKRWWEGFTLQGYQSLVPHNMKGGGEEILLVGKPL